MVAVTWVRIRPLLATATRRQPVPGMVVAPPLVLAMVALTLGLVMAAPRLEPDMAPPLTRVLPTLARTNRTLPTSLTRALTVVSGQSPDLGTQANRDFVDLDGSRTVGGNKTHSTTHGNTAVGAGFGSSTTTGAGHSTTGAGHGPTTAGPYSSNLANKADPRVDSDLDGRGGYGSSTTTGAGYGSSTRAGHSTTGAGLGSTTGAGHSTTGTGYGSTTAGPHSSNLGNKADPRVDSDLDGRGGYGSSATTGAGHSTSTTGAGYGSSTIGAGYGSSTAGAGYGSSTTTAGSGPAPNTAGPHKSDMLNKMDPRVDSDNSKTSG